MLTMWPLGLTLENVSSQMLKSVGAGGHYPTNKLQAEDGGPAATVEVQKSWLTSFVDRTVGRVQALAETAIFAFYKVTHCRHPKHIESTHNPIAAPCREGLRHVFEKDLNTLSRRL